MGGADKGLLEARGRPLILQLVERIAPQVEGRVLVNCNRNMQRYRGFGLRCVQDTPGLGAGPLAGIASAMRCIDTPWCLVCPCDTPDVPSDLLVRLYSALAEQGGALACAHDGERVQGLHLLLRTDLCEPLTRWLTAGGRAVQAWLTEQHACEVDFSDCAGAFRNLNTPADVRCWEAGQENLPA